MLLLVRHGETGPNVESRLLGRADPELTEVGRAQAAALATALPAPDVVISSPLGRARATAAAFDREVEIDERWIELDYGDLEGSLISDLGDEQLDRWRSDVSYAPAGVETLESLGYRVRAACADVSRRATDQTVVVVTHVSPMKAALAWALGTDDAIAWRMFVEDAGVSRIDFGPHGPVVRWFNRGL